MHEWHKITKNERWNWWLPPHTNEYLYFTSEDDGFSDFSPKNIYMTFVLIDDDEEEKENFIIAQTLN